jgi:sugar lactone lactonase YvrE
MRRTSFIASLTILLSLVVMSAAATPPAPGTLEVVAELPINPGNLAVTAEGRVFATVHQFRRGPAQLIEITGRTDYRPWPNASWNGPFGSTPNVLNSVLGISIDRKGRLWVIDNGRGETDLQPKLLAFSLTNGELAFRYDFPQRTGPKGSFLNDLAVDARRGFVYLADVGGLHDPALVVVDINRQESRRFTGSPALAAEDVDLIVDGRVVRVPDEQGEPRPARIAVNPITLSADGETLYFGAMNGQTWYALPAQLLREGASDSEIAAAIEAAGKKPVSDGASTDRAGNHYFTNLGANAIDVLQPDGTLKHLVQDERLLWPDALSFGEESSLYVAVNQLHRSPALNGGVEAGEPPYLIMRVWTGTEGIPGR